MSSGFPDRVRMQYTSTPSPAPSSSSSTHSHMQSQRTSYTPAPSGSPTRRGASTPTEHSAPTEMAPLVAADAPPRAMRVSGGGGGGGGGGSGGSGARSWEGWAWLALWFCLNVGVTLLNKAIFHFYTFKFPLALTFVHMLSSSLYSYMYLNFWNTKIPETQLDERGKKLILGFSVLFCANIAVGNASLKHATVSLSQVVRSCIPAVTMAFSIMFLHKVYPQRMYVALSPVVLGAVLASVGEAEFNTIGISLLLLVCVLASLKVVVNNKLLVGRYKHNPVRLLNRLAPLAAVQLVVYMVLLGEWTRLNEWIDTSENMNGSFLLFLIANGAMAFMLNISNFEVNRKLSPLTLTVAGNVKHVVTIFLSIMMFQNVITPLNGLGTLIAICGAAMYSREDYLWRMEQKRAAQSNV